MNDNFKNNIYARSLNLFKRLTVFYSQNKFLKEEFSFDGFDLWYCLQMRLFTSIYHYYSNELNNNKSDKYNTKKTKVFIKIKNFFIYLFLFLMSVFSFLKILFFKRDVIIYSIDLINSKYLSDKRIEYLYDFVIKNNLKYMEVFHTVINKKPILNFFKRKRLSFYLEFLDFLRPFLKAKIDHKLLEDVSNLVYNKKDKIFIKKLFSDYLMELKLLKLKMKAYAFIFSFLKVKYIFMIDDTRYYFPLVYAGKKNKIKTVAFQHGHFTKYHVGWIDYLKRKNMVLKPDKIFVFSEYWKKELLRLGSYFNEKEIFIIGNLSKNKNHFFKKKSNKKYLGVLIPYETNAPKKEVFDYISKLLECKNVKIFFKLRTDMDKEEQIKDYFLDKYKDKIIFIDEVLPYVDRIDLVFGVYSTFLYDLILQEKPVFILNTSMDYGDGLLKNRLADLVDNPSDVCKVLCMAKSIDSRLIKKRRDTLLSKTNDLIFEKI